MSPRLVTLAFLVGSAWGCAQTPPARPAPAPRQAHHERREKDFEPRFHVAPPPAYGNKVVLAETDDDSIDL